MQTLEIMEQRMKSALFNGMKIRSKKILSEHVGKIIIVIDNSKFVNARDIKHCLYLALKHTNYRKDIKILTRFNEKSFESFNFVSFAEIIIVSEV